MRVPQNVCHSVVMATTEPPTYPHSRMVRINDGSWQCETCGLSHETFDTVAALDAHVLHGREANGETVKAKPSTPLTPDALRKIIAEHAADAATASGAAYTAGLGIGTRRVLADLCALIGEPEPWAA